MAQATGWKTLQRLDSPAPHGLQGGVVIIQGFGCVNCGGGFWVEANGPSENPPGSVLHCPHCGKPGKVT